MTTYRPTDEEDGVAPQVTLGTVRHPDGMEQPLHILMHEPIDPWEAGHRVHIDKESGEILWRDLTLSQTIMMPFVIPL